MLIDFLLRQQCEIQPWLGAQDGTDRYGPSERRACRLQRGRTLADSGMGSAPVDEVRAKALMFCRGEPIPERSRVTCGGEKYTVLSCYKAQGFGEEHLEVMLQ